MVWNCAHVLKNAGVEYRSSNRGIEQITYLLLALTFGLRPVAQPYGLPVSSRIRGTRLLKLADEMIELGFDNPISDEFKWSELSSKSGDALEPIGARWTIRQDHPEGWRGGVNQIRYRHALENFGKEPGVVSIMLNPSLPRLDMDGQPELG